MATSGESNGELPTVDLDESDIPGVVFSASFEGHAIPELRCRLLSPGMLQRLALSGKSYTHSTI